MSGGTEFPTTPPLQGSNSGPRDSEPLVLALSRMTRHEYNILNSNAKPKDMHVHV